MDVIHYFAARYDEARHKFLEACRAVAGRVPIEVTSIEHPLRGPAAEPLATDVAVIGQADARRVLLLLAGTHGNEGFCGSGCMVGFLRSGGWSRLGNDVRVVLVHALNPHGFAHVRRVTEDNVDLNRNFVDHDAGLPANAAYAEIADDLVPPDWTGAAREAADARLLDYARTHGLFALQTAICQGQYTHPGGLFYGGSRPTWSNLTLRRIVRERVLPAETVALIDYHTGLGPYGCAELIHEHAPDSAAAARLRDWYGNGLATTTDGTSASPPLQGTTHTGVRSELPREVGLVDVSAEFGTFSLRRVIDALRGDHWLHLNPDADPALAASIKAEIGASLYPDEDDWKELVYLRSRQIVDRAISALAAGR